MSGILSVRHPSFSVVLGILSVGYPNISVVSGILSVGHPNISVVSGILSVVGIPPVPEEIQLLMYANAMLDIMIPLFIVVCITSP